MIDLGYAELLRSVLRQNPDIIMIGEIRDPETAQLAVHAANTNEGSDESLVYRRVGANDVGPLRTTVP